MPFGEYIPLLAVARLGLPALTTLTRGGFTPGGAAPRQRRRALPPFLPLICYEAIFPGGLRAPEGRPEWLVQITNDAWFGEASGPWQHLAQARMRAIEQGLPLARAANTGISAMIDPHGRVVARLGLGETGAVDALLPGVLPATFYSRYGDLPGLDCNRRHFGINCFQVLQWNFPKAATIAGQGWPGGTCGEHSRQGVAAIGRRAAPVSRVGVRGEYCRCQKSASEIDVHVGLQHAHAQGGARHQPGPARAGTSGLTFSQIQKYEKGANRIGAGRLYQIASFLGVHAEPFLRGALGRRAAADAPANGGVRRDEFATLNDAFSSINDRETRASVLALVRSLAADAARRE